MMEVRSLKLSASIKGTMTSRLLLPGAINKPKSILRFIGQPIRKLRRKKDAQAAASAKKAKDKADATAAAKAKSDADAKAKADAANTAAVAAAVTVSQKNALSKAKSYLSYTAFSHDGLVDQLVYEQFSTADATYGADNCGADWNAQAAKKAKSYMSYSSFSRGSLIAQLEYDKFTSDQATYGANSVGL